MFTFFHRSKTIEVNCFTPNNFAYEYAPIVRGTKAFPDWWKKLPIGDAANDIEYKETKKNMRKCYGFIELYKRSLVIPSWTDLHYKVTPDKGYNWLKGSHSANSPQEHDKIQYQGGFDNYYHTKLMSPWYIKESTGIHFLFTAASWNLENYDFTIPPGLLEFSVNHGTHVNMFLPKKKQDYSFFIPTGKPLVHLIPLDEKVKINLRCHLLTEQEFKKLEVIPGTLAGVYSLHSLKKQQNEKKCPFGFGKSV